MRASRIAVAEVVVPISLRPTCARSRHRRVATASAANLTPLCDRFVRG
jgi:hypothetical protein